MEFDKVMRPQIINLELDAKTKEEALDKLSDMLLKDEAIASKDAYLKDVYLREKLGPTGIGNYIAIPHGKSESVIKTSVAFAKLVNPIQWETLDGEPVKLIFLFAVPAANEDNLHLQLLSQLAAVLAYDESQEQLLNAKSAEEVLQIIVNRKTHV